MLALLNSLNAAVKLQKGIFVLLSCLLLLVQQCSHGHFILSYMTFRGNQTISVTVRQRLLHLLPGIFGPLQLSQDGRRPLPDSMFQLPSQMFCRF